MTKVRNRVVAVSITCLMVILTVFVPTQVAALYVNSSVQYTVYSGSGNYLGTYSLDEADYVSSLAQTYSIIGNDDRYGEYLPGVVDIYVNGARGTGFVVSDHVIATAAHIVYNNGGRSISRINFFDTNGSSILSITDAKEVHVPTNYFSSGSTDSNYDYALIYVDEDLSDFTYFNLGYVLDDYSGSVSVTGFQEDNEKDSKFPNESATGTGSMINVTDYQCEYDADTTSGVSGSPVYVKTTSYNGAVSYTVIAIHTSGGTNSNFGTRITTNLLQFYLNNSYLGSFK